MKFLRRSRPTKEYRPSAFSLIDIGRDTVKVAVVLSMPGTAEPQVVGYGLASTGDHDITGGRLEANAVTTSVNAALTQAEDSTENFIGQKIVPDDAIFALAGRATLGKLFVVRQVRSQPAKPISVKELDNLRTRAERLVRQGLANLPLEGGQWQALAVSDAGIRLDQHLVLDGVGLTGQEISFSVFGVAGQAATLRAIQVLADRLDLGVANIVASTQALATITPHAEAIILDTGLAGTDICLIRDNALVGTIWVPFGGRFFTQALAQGIEIGLDKAAQLKLAFSIGGLTPAEMARLDQVLDGPRHRWYEAVMQALDELALQTETVGINGPDQPLPGHSGHKSLPRRIYLTGGGNLLPGLDRLLRSDPTPFDSAPEVTRLGSRSLPGIKDLTDSINYNLSALVLSLTAGLPN